MTQSCFLPKVICFCAYPDDMQARGSRSDPPGPDRGRPGNESSKEQRRTRRPVWSALVSANGRAPHRSEGRSRESHERAENAKTAECDHSSRETGSRANQEIRRRLIAHCKGRRRHSIVPRRDRNKARRRVLLSVPEDTPTCRITRPRGRIRALQRPRHRRAIRPRRPT